ncbi:MAG: hypothetical protein ACK55I_46320, partial [bacterium]
ADTRVLHHRLPEEHRHERVLVEPGRFLRRGASPGAERPGEAVGMDLAQFERQPVVLHGVEHLRARVGEGRPVGHPRLPLVEGLDRPVGVVVGERPLEWLFDEVDERPGDEEADEHPQRQPERGPDEA